MRSSAICVALVGAAVGLAFPTASRADIYYLTSDHCTGGCGPSGTVFGTVEVTQTVANDLHFVVSLNDGSKIVNTGFPISFGFNLDPNQTITYVGLPGTYTIPNEIGTTDQQAAGSYHMDGTGFFEYGVLFTAQGGGAGTDSTLTFDITGTSLTLLSIVQNLAGNFFAVDIISGLTGFTGPVDASSPPGVVPLPPAALLFGTALLGMGMLGRRRKKRLAQAAI
jgi:hypothetical protein